MYKSKLSVRSTGVTDYTAKEEMELHGCLIPAEEVFPEREIGTGEIFDGSNFKILIEPVPYYMA